MKASCYWITGLSGSGKTTLAKKLSDYLRSKNLPVILLDGDVLREILSSKAYTYDERLNLGYKYAKLCKALVEQDINVVIGVIGLFHKLHSWNRLYIESYVEIFLDTPIDELRKRDPKKLYHKFSEKKLSNIVGIDIEPEFPKEPNLHLKWEEGMNEDKTFIKVKEFLNI